MNLRSALERFWEEIVPSPWWRAWTALVGLLLIVWAWDRRGPLVGVVAVITYAFVFGFATLRPGAQAAWSERHPVLDRAFMVPCVFIGLATLTSWPLVLCLACGLAAWGIGVAWSAVSS